MEEAFRDPPGIPEGIVSDWQGQSFYDEAEIQRCRTIVQTVLEYQERAIQLYSGQIDLKGLVLPPVNREFVKAAEQYLGNVENIRFVLSPPKNFFALKPKQEDICYLYACAGVLANYYTWKADWIVHTNAVRASMPQVQENYAREAQRELVYADKADIYREDSDAGDAIYLGDLLNPLEPMAAQVLERGRWFDGENLHLPFSYRAGHPFVLFVDCVSEQESTARSRAGALVRAVMYQFTRAMKPYTYQFYHIDPRGGGSSLNAFSDLKKVVNGCVYQLNSKLFKNHRYVMMESAGTQAAAGEMLKALDEYIASAITICGGDPDIASYNVRQAEISEREGQELINLVPQRLVIFENIHGAIGSHEKEILCKAIENAQKSGISLIITSCRQNQTTADSKTAAHDPGLQHENALRSCCPDIILWDDVHCQIQVSAATMGEQITRESDVPKRYLYLFQPLKGVEEAPQSYIDSLRECLKPRFNFDTTYEKRVSIDDVWGTSCADEGITIPIGVNQAGKVASITIGSSKAAHILMNGTTGCGKSTLLHDIINGVIVHYRPDDVQIWLSDYKSNEFMRYTENTPPHIRYVATDTSKEYSFDFLNRIWAEYERRQKLFGSITSVAEYRRVHGQGTMPRLLIIVDEFHVLSDHIRTEPVYKERLERLLREIRAFGMTLFFSDQTGKDGLNGLTDNAKKQMNFRMSMVAERDDYNAAFDIKNAMEIPELADLVPHQVTLRRSRTEINELGQKVQSYYFEQCSTLYLTPETRARLALRSIECYGVCKDPVFVLRPERSKADWKTIRRELAGCTEDDTMAVCLGIPTNSRKFAWFGIENNFRENVMCIGSQVAMQASVLESFLESVFQSGRAYEICVLADPHARMERACRNWLRARQAADEHFHFIKGNEQLCEAIYQLWQEKERRRTLEGVAVPVFVVWLGLEDICQNLMYFKGDHPSAKTGTMLYDADSHVKELMEANCAIHHMVFYQSVSAIRIARCARPESFRHKISFSMGRDDACDFLGSARPLMTADEKYIGEDTAVYYNGSESTQFKPFYGTIEKNDAIPDALFEKAELVERRQEQQFRERKASWLAGETPNAGVASPDQDSAQEEQSDLSALLNNNLFNDPEPMSQEEQQLWFSRFEDAFGKDMQPSEPAQPLRFWYIWDGAANRQLMVCNHSGMAYGWDDASQIWVRLTAQMFVYDQPSNGWKPLPMDEAGYAVLQ